MTEFDPGKMRDALLGLTERERKSLEAEDHARKEADEALEHARLRTDDLIVKVEAELTSKVVLDAEGLPLEAEKGKIGHETVRPRPKPKPKPKRPKRRRAPEPESETEKESRTGSRCSAYSPRGTVCKLCGKVHPL